jgi:hypothetical protein
MSSVQSKGNVPRPRRTTLRQEAFDRIDLVSDQKRGIVKQCLPHLSGTLPPKMPPAQSVARRRVVWRNR